MGEGMSKGTSSLLWDKKQESKSQNPRLLLWAWAWRGMCKANGCEGMGLNGDCPPLWALCKQWVSPSPYTLPLFKVKGCLKDSRRQKGLKGSRRQKGPVGLGPRSRSNLLSQD